MNLFEKQVAVLTGAGSGIGRAMVMALAMEGATLCLVGRSREKLETSAERIRPMASRVTIYPVDLSEEAQIVDLKNRLRKDVNQIDILIHSAGIFSMGRMEISPSQVLDAQYRVNLRAPYLLTQALLPALRASKGQIVFLNSSVGLSACANVGPYAATKHGLKALADSLRDEINEEGLRVLSVFLGRTATPMQAAIFETEGKEYQPDRLIQPEDVATIIIAALQLPRTAEVTDIHIRPMLKN